MTSNLGSQTIQQMAGKVSYEAMKQAVLEIASSHFRPEFLNRIDEIVVFHPLGQKQIHAIAKVQIARLKARLAEKNIQ
jgi:ATP-dependent Clp protease ATP-binding subunit ClpB